MNNGTSPHSLNNNLAFPYVSSMLEHSIEISFLNPKSAFQAISLICMFENEFNVNLYCITFMKYRVISSKAMQFKSIRPNTLKYL